MKKIMSLLCALIIVLAMTPITAKAVTIVPFQIPLKVYEVANKSPYHRFVIAYYPTTKSFKIVIAPSTQTYPNLQVLGSSVAGKPLSPTIYLKDAPTNVLLTYLYTYETGIVTTQTQAAVVPMYDYEIVRSNFDIRDVSGNVVYSTSQNYPVDYSGVAGIGGGYCPECGKFISSFPCKYCGHTGEIVAEPFNPAGIFTAIQGVTDSIGQTFADFAGSWREILMTEFYGGLKRDLEWIGNFMDVSNPDSGIAQILGEIKAWGSTINANVKAGFQAIGDQFNPAVEGSFARGVATWLDVINNSIESFQQDVADQFNPEVAGSFAQRITSGITSIRGSIDVFWMSMTNQFDPTSEGSIAWRLTRWFDGVVSSIDLARLAIVNKLDEVLTAIPQQLDPSNPDGFVGGIGAAIGGIAQAMATLAGDILALPGQILSGISDLLVSLIKPGDTFFTDNFDGIKAEFGAKFQIPTAELEALEGINGQGMIEGISGEIGGKTVKFIDFSMWTQHLPALQSMIRGFMYPLLLFANINYIYFLIRGKSLFARGEGE